MKLTFYLFICTYQSITSINMKSVVTLQSLLMHTQSTIAEIVLLPSGNEDRSRDMNGNH